MLCDDLTTAAIVAGFACSFDEWSVPYDTVEELQSAVKALNEKHSLSLKVLVAGDTTDTGVGEAGGVVIGLPVIVSECYADPTAFSSQKVRDALADFPELPDTYFDELREAVEDFKGPDSESPQALLLSWGPLCYGALNVGVAMTQDGRDDAVYGFIANQDNYQEWTFGGLDGKHITSVEFDSITDLDLSEEAVQGYVEMVPEFDNPVLFLSCRYD